MKTRLIIILLSAGALAFAWGPHSDSESPVALASVLPTRATPAVGRRGRGSSGRAEVKLKSKFDVAVRGREVEFALTVRNVGGKHAELNFANGQAYDFVVLDSTGREVWQWSNGRMFTQLVQNKQLGGGDAMRVSESWNRHGAAAGRYTVVATLKSSNYPTEERAEFVLP